MKNFIQAFPLFLLLFISGFAFGQTTFFQESFETTTGYTFPNGNGGSGQDFFDRANLSGAPTQEVFSYNSFDGTYFVAAEDIDGVLSSSTGVVLISGVNISGQSNLELTASFASGTDVDIDDANDAMWVEVRIDGGSWVEIGRFEADPSTTSGTGFNGQFAEDTNGDGDGDGARLDGDFTDFTWNISGTGNTLDIRISMDLNSGDEEGAFDNVRIAGTSSGPATPTVTTTAASSVTTNSASSGGDVTADGGSSVTARGIVYNTSGTPDLSDNVITSGSGTGTFTSNLSGLNASTTYYVRAYATNAQGTAYGQEEQFTTLTPCLTPSTQSGNLSFSATTDSETTLSWTNGDGDGRVVIMNTSNSFTNPTDGNDPSANATWQNSGEQVIYNGSGNSVTVDGLSATTTYWFRVYEYNCSGTGILFNTNTASDNPNSVTTISGPCFEESFSNVGPYGGYQTETWTGDEGYDFTATDARTDQSINGSAITVRNGELSVENVSGGIGALTLTTERAFSGGSGDLDVLVNGNQVGTIPYSGFVQTSSISGIDVGGTFDLEIQTPGNGDRVAMDDLSWTCYVVPSDPEPTNHPTGFSCNSVAYNTIDLSWTDATGAQLPAGYLIKWSDISYADITDPTDGSDANGANSTTVNQGQETASIAGLDASTTYYFKIYAYTNTGVNIDYKTDGSIQQSDCTTLVAPPVQNYICENLEAGNLNNWGSTSDWAASTSSAINGSYSLKHDLSGVDGKSYINYDLSSENVDLDFADNTWQFNLSNGSWDPSSNNYFGVFLTANSLNLGYSTQVDGYLVGLNFNSTDDLLKLYEVTDLWSGSPTITPIITSSYNWNQNATVGIRVTRSSTGNWELFLDTDGDFDNLVSEGTASNTTYNFSSGNNYFGLVFEYSSSRAGDLWLDDVSYYQGNAVCPVTSSGPYHWLPTSGSHDFTDAANWSPQRTNIQNDDILIFDNGGSSVATNVPAQTVGQIEIASTDITFAPNSQAGIQTFTIAGVLGDDDFKVDANSVFTLDAPSDFDIVINSGATAEIFGDVVIYSTGTQAAHGFKPEDTGAGVFKNGSSFTQGPKSTGNIFGGNTGASNAVVFESGSEFVTRSGANPFGKAQPDSKVEFQSGSLYKHEKAAEPSLVGRTYADIEFNYNGTTGFLSGSTSGDDFTCDDFTVSQGELLFTYSLVQNPLNLNIDGDLTIATGSKVTFAPDDAAATSSIILSGSAAQNINGNGTLEIGEFGKLEIDNNVIVNSPTDVYGILELKSGQLTTNNNLTIASDVNSTGIIDDFTNSPAGTISGDVTVERYVENPNNGFHFIGSPIASANVADWGNEFSIAATNGGSNGAQVIPTPTCSPTALAQNSPYGGLFDYREDQVTDCRFEGWHVRTSGTVGPAQGFAGIISDGTVIDLSGSANTGNITSNTLTKTAANTTSNQGFNMLSNPYPSPVEWTDVAAANTGIDGTAYLFQTSGSYNGTFQPINDITGGTIASSQAFQVEALSNNVTVGFDNSMRRTSGNNDFLRKAQPYDNKLTLELEGNGFADRTIVAYSDNFTAGYDRSYDAKKLKSNQEQPTIYTFSNPAIEKQAINAIAKNDKYDVLPVGLIAGMNGNYTITASDLNTFDPMEVLFLEDLKTGSVHNLRENPVYSFNADVNDAAHRFNLHVMPAPEHTSTAVNCVKEPGYIQIDFGGFAINGQNINWDNAQLIDANGQIVKSNAALTANWNVDSLQAGTYDLVLQMGNYTVSQLITVDALAAVEVDYSVDQSVVAVGEAVNFTNLSIGANQYEWDMGDGQVIYNTINPSYSYLSPGTYDVLLTASSDDCSDQLAKQLEVREKVSLSIENNNIEAYKVYSHQNTIVIEAEDLANSDVRIYNTLGQQVLNDVVLSTNSKLELQLPTASTGIYFVRVLNDKDYITEQVFIKNTQ